MIHHLYLQPRSSGLRNISTWICHLNVFSSSRLFLGSCVGNGITRAQHTPASRPNMTTACAKNGFYIFKKERTKKTKTQSRIYSGDHIRPTKPKTFPGLPWWRSGLESSCQCRTHGFEPWSGKIPHVAEQLSPCTTTTELVL